MLEIRESTSPFSSNVVIVRKMDRTIRFSIGYRKLNQRTEKDAYLIPRIDDTLPSLAGSKYFSTLHLKSGYWQVDLREIDKAKSAFQVGSLYFYECNRMPFGLCNAPATFLRLMERCMGDLRVVFKKNLKLKPTTVVLRRKVTPSWTRSSLRVREMSTTSTLPRLILFHS